MFSQEGDKLIRLWIHEVYRVFYDRLIDHQDREMFFNIVQDRTSSFFKQTIDKVIILHLCTRVHTHNRTIRLDYKPFPCLIFSSWVT